MRAKYSAHLLSQKAAKTIASKKPFEAVFLAAKGLNMGNEGRLVARVSRDPSPAHTGTAAARKGKTVLDLKTQATPAGAARRGCAGHDGLERAADRDHANLGDLAAAQHHHELAFAGLGSGQHMAAIGGVVGQLFHVPLALVVGVERDVMDADFACALCESSGGGEEGDEEGKKLSVLFHGEARSEC